MQNAHDSLTSRHKKNTRWIEIPLKMMNQFVKTISNILVVKLSKNIKRHPKEI